MGDNPDLTLVILGQMRDEMRGIRQDIQATNERLQGTNERLDAVVREQIRQGTAIIELQQGQREIVGALHQIVDTLVSIDRRTGALEQGQERIVDELHAIHDRIDNVLIGTMGTTVRDDHARLASVEARVSVLERRTG